MNPLFGLISFITVISAVWSVYSFQSANAFPHGHASSSSSSSSASSASPTSSNDNDSGNNSNNDNDNDNTDGNSNEPITIELPVSPSVQSPTRVTFITDNDNSPQQYQTLQSDELLGQAADASSTGNEDSSSSSSSSSSIFNQDNNGPRILSPFQYNAAYNYVNNNNGESNSNSNSNDVLPSFPSHDNSGNSFYTNQATFPAMRPTNIPMDTLFKRLAILIERRRNRQARIQSFRQVLLRGTGRSGHSSHRFHGHRNPNMAHARRAALQAFRNRLATN